MNSNTLITVASVIYNDESIIEQYINETTEVLKENFGNYEFILIDNASTDNSAKIIQTILKKTTNLRLIQLSRKYDDEIAQTAALENSIGDYVVLMDINTDPPSAIPEMVEACSCGCDMIIGQKDKRNDESLFYQLCAKLFYKINYLLTGYKLNSKWSNFVCFSRKMVNAIIQVKDRSKYLKLVKFEIGFKKSSFPYNAIKRSNKPVKINYLKKISQALEIVIAHSDTLLRLASFLAFMAATVNFLYIGYVLFEKLFVANIAPGWASTSIVSSMTYGILFIVLAILAEYIAYIFYEIKKSPLYYVKDEYNSTCVFESMTKKNITDGEAE